jgi:deoxyadenosine/deoxycytidine kinase
MLVAVTGPIAAGATTLAKRFVDVLGWLPVLEADVESSNQFFARYHARPERYAFHNQVAFLIQSAELHARIIDTDRSHDTFVQDYTPFEHTEVYAAVMAELGILDETEYALVQRLAKQLTNSFVVPSILIYRDLSVSALGKRVKERGRPSEQDLQDTFLMAIRERFERWAKEWSRSPILRIDPSTDVLSDDAVVQQIALEALSMIGHPIVGERDSPLEK